MVAEIHAQHHFMDGNSWTGIKRKKWAEFYQFSQVTAIGDGQSQRGSDREASLSVLQKKCFLEWWRGGPMSDFYDLNSPCLNTHLSPEAMGSPFHVIICISWACVCTEYSWNILKVVRHVAASSSMAQCLRRLGDNGTQSICLKKGSSLEWRHS